VATPVTMPMLGLTMEEGTVAEWLKRVGESVTKDEPLLTVEMDKGTIEVPSPASGVLSRIIVQPGQTVAVKTLIAEIGAPGEAPTGGPTAAPAGPPAPAEPSTWVAPGALSAQPSPAAPSAQPSPTAPPSPAAPTGPAAPAEPTAPPATAAVGGDGGLPAATKAPSVDRQQVTPGADATPHVPPGGDATPYVTPGAPARPDVTPGVTAGVTPGVTPVDYAGGWRRGMVGPGGAVGGVRERLFASPRARLRARELGVELDLLTGSGPNGRIVEDDVLQAATGRVGQVEQVVAVEQLEQLEQPERVLTTPLARRLALEHGVSIDAVRGTGPGGRITQEDVLRTAAAAQAAPASTAAPAPTAASAPTAAPAPPAPAPMPLEPGAPGPPPTPAEVAAAAAAPAPAELAAPPAAPSPAQAAAVGGVQPLSRVRRITAERMVQSARTVARVTITLEADFSEAARFRQQLQPEFARLGVPKLPWDALIARAAGLALLEHPVVNAQWVEGQGLRFSPAVHVGIAVALESEGLVVPVLRDAHTRSLRELAADLLSLTERAQSKRLSSDDMQGGTFTITNLGQYRVEGFTPIINPPETAILGVGRIALKPAVVEGRVEPRTQCTLSLSFDHRVVDGAPAAAFLARLAELLERPYTLLGI
jgi:pyruvate dehydrogenase E2 component (dihydrolipoamide acetyltransferase)